MSGTALHERFRSRLEALASDDAVVRHLPDERAWRRTYGRFTPEAASYATLVYESETGAQSIVRVDAFERRPDRDGAMHVDELGWLRCARFPEDEALPTLGAALRDEHHVHVVRYRPGRRCTLAVGEPPRRYVKVFSDDRCARLYAESSAGRSTAGRSHRPPGLRPVLAGRCVRVVVVEIEVLGAQ